MKDFVKKISNSFVPVFLLGAITVACKKEVDSLEPMRMFTPAGAIKSDNGETQVKLTWNPSLYTTAKSGVTYTVEVAADTLFATPVILTVQTDTSGVMFTDKQLDIKTNYFARIRANALGDRPESKPVVSNRFSIRGEQIFSPIIGNDIRDKSVLLRWRNTADLTKIVVNRVGGNNPIEFNITAEDIEAQQKRLTGLTPSQSYVAEIFAGTRSKGTISFTTKEESNFTYTVAAIDDLQEVISNAENGDVIGLTAGIYSLSTAVTILEKSISLISVSGNPTDTKVNFKEITLKGTGAGIRLEGIEFDGAAANADYFINLEATPANFGSIIVENCIVRNTNNCILRGNRAATSAQSIELIKFNNFQGYKNGGSYTYFTLDKLQFGKLEITNSTFHDLGRSLVNCGTPLTGAKPVIFIDASTFNYFGAENQWPLIDANANPVDITIQNSIIGNIPKDGAVSRNDLLRASASTVRITNSNLFKLTNGANPPASLNIPAYVQQSALKSIDLGWTATTTDFSLPANSELRTASTTGGAIGDPRWTR